jgi:predicted anti-sigma-YlaC factor YlaD
MTGGVFASDEDPDLVREASPFGLKLMESVLSSQPEHHELLTALARGFTQYAYAFVELDAAEVEADSLEQAEALRARARKLYLRAREYGLRALEVAEPGFRAELVREPRRAARRLGRDQIETLYWTCAAWGLSLALSKDEPEAVADQPLLEALLDRALELDEAYGEGALRALLLVYEPARIGAERGALDRSRAHYARAVELSGGLSAGPHVALAETASVARQDRAEFLRLLGLALAVDPDVAPGLRRTARRSSSRRWCPRARATTSRCSRWARPGSRARTAASASRSIPTARWAARRTWCAASAPDSSRPRWSR